MDPQLLEIILASEELQIIRRDNVRINHRHLRDTSNPFELPEMNFRMLFRLSIQMAVDLVNQLTPFLTHNSERVSAIPLTIKVLSALFFYAHGSYQKSVGTSYLFGLSQASVSRCINNVTEALYVNLINIWIKFPLNRDEKQVVKRGFYEKFGLSGVVGVIDGSHIAIVAPSSRDEQFPGHLYINRKGYHSINVQLVCDANLKLLAVNARHPGSVHDAAIWMTSGLQQHLRQQYNEGDRSSRLLGDSGYPLQPWLFTPIIGAEANTPQSRYNQQFATARNSIERCIGVLKLRFRCLLRHRVLHYNPTTACKIIYACCILHNMCVHNNVMPFADDEFNFHEEEMEAENDGVDIADGSLLEEGRRIRDNYVANNY